MGDHITMGAREVLHHTGKLALILTAVGFILSILLFATPWWYHISWTNSSTNYGLIKYKTCSGDTCLSGHIRGDYNQTPDYVTAANVAVSCFCVAWVVTIVYFITGVLHMSGKQFGPLRPAQLALVNLVLTIVIMIAYIIILVSYPLLFGGSTQSGGYLNYHETYYWSYYLMIPVVIIAIIAAMLNGGAIRGSSYAPIK